jgi:formylmethanofuran dehydrogenase subunit E
MSDQPRTFDHTALEHLSEYHDLRRAVDALAQRIDRLQPEEMSRAGFIELVADLARTSYAADNCDACQEMCWPIRAEVAGRWMSGTYWCPRCKKTWQCGYTTHLALR